MQRFIYILLALFSMNTYADSLPTMTCLFEEFIGVSHESPEEISKSKIRQSMKVINGKTTDETLALDGSLRATNSRQWNSITLKDRQTWETRFLGDFNEILSLAHELGANKKHLHGWYKASLVSTGVSATSIHLGNCFFE